MKLCLCSCCSANIQYSVCIFPRRPKTSGASNHSPLVPDYTDRRSTYARLTEWRETKSTNAPDASRIRELDTLQREMLNCARQSYAAASKLKDYMSGCVARCHWRMAVDAPKSESEGPEGGRVERICIFWSFCRSWFREALFLDKWRNRLSGTDTCTCTDISSRFDKQETYFANTENSAL
jgi:hypothetical protein